MLHDPSRVAPRWKVASMHVYLQRAEHSANWSEMTCFSVRVSALISRLRIKKLWTLPFLLSSIICTDTHTSLHAHTTFQSTFSDPRLTNCPPARLFCLSITLTCPPTTATVHPLVICPTYSHKQTTTKIISPHSVHACPISATKLPASKLSSLTSATKLL